MKKLGFGCMRLPQGGGDYSHVDIDAFKEMVDAYMKNGYNYFDTSYVYHMGNSEPAIKECVVKRYPRESFTITDKMPVWLPQKTEDYKTIFNEQLERCGVTYFDYYWFHTLGSTFIEKCEELGGFDFLKSMKKEGKTRHIGFSFHDTADVLDKFLDNHPEMEYVQLIVNYIDWTNGGIEIKKCYETVVRHNRQVVIMEPIKGGILANVPDEIKKIFKEYNYNYSPASLALRWAASLNNVFKVLSGMSSLEQLEDNMKTFDNLKPLNDEEKLLIERTRTILNKKAPNDCTYCGKCQKVCHKDIAIPTYIGLYNNRKMFAADGWQNNIYDAVKTRHGKIEDCDQCNKCIDTCPQKLQIVEILKSAVETLVPPYSI